MELRRQICEHGKLPDEYCFDCVRKQHNEDVLDGRFDEDERPPPAKTIEQLAGELAEAVSPDATNIAARQRANLTRLLIQFAEEIQRRSVEP